MKLTNIYQTVEDRGNLREATKHGPFFCSKKDDSGIVKKGTREPWLGEGYYFWDSFIEDAKWWGREAYQNNYYIFETQYDQHSEYLFDTLGDLTMLQEFEEYANALRKTYRGKSLTVSFVIEYLKRNTDFSEKYKAIRMFPYSTKKRQPSLYFPGKKAQFLEVERVQICFFDKTLLVYPYKYVSL